METNYKILCSFLRLVQVVKLRWMTSQVTKRISCCNGGTTVGCLWEIMDNERGAGTVGIDNYKVFTRVGIVPRFKDAKLYGVSQQNFPTDIIWAVYTRWQEGTNIDSLNRANKSNHNSHFACSYQARKLGDAIKMRKLDLWRH